MSGRFTLLVPFHVLHFITKGPRAAKGSKQILDLSLLSYFQVPLKLVGSRRGAIYQAIISN